MGKHGIFKKCSEIDCNGRHYARGLCKNHWRRYMRRGIIKPISTTYRIKHGGVDTAEYIAWNNMKARCNNRNNPMYKYYGGRGIRVCRRWSEFNNFIKDMGKKPHELMSLDRIDNDGGYNKDNCRWVSMSVQINNQQKNKLYKYNGLSMTLAAWINHIKDHDASLPDTETDQLDLF